MPCFERALKTLASNLNAISGLCFQFSSQNISHFHSISESEVDRIWTEMIFPEIKVAKRLVQLQLGQGL